MAQVGRISGPLLESNLIRNGIDLQFSNYSNNTPLLYLNVGQTRIGVNQPIPLDDLDITGSFQALNSESIQANIANFNFQNSNISVQVGNLYLNAASNIAVNDFSTDDILIKDNVISTKTFNTNLELRPTGSGTVEIFSNLNTYGNIHADGDINIQGQITFGNQNTDTVNFNADVISDIIPNLDGIYNIGSSTYKFANLYSAFLNGTVFVANSVGVGNVSLATRVGNTFFVAENGDDANVGDHPHGPFRTIKRALEFSDASINGPVTIHVYPGTYEEELPLIVPTNVTVNGEDIRNVIVKPAAGYEGNDVFLLNGETTIQNLTIKKDPPNLSFVLDNPNAFGTSQSDYFGRPISISESYAIVGAFQEDDAGGTTSGKAYIYDTSTGNLLHTLDNPNPFGSSSGDNFGTSVAISESYAIVGASFEDESGNSSSGKAYIYDTSTGNLLHTLDNPNAFGTSSGDVFGFSVSISESYAIVGAPFEDDAGGFTSGKAYIYDTSTGNLLHTLDNPNPFGSSSGDNFGYSVSISESYAIVGAYIEDQSGYSQAGKAYIYDNSTGNLLHTLDNPNAFGTAADDFFGLTVAISESYAIVGALYEDDAGGIESGKAYIFDTSTGNLLHTLDNPNAYGSSADDRFGTSVSISESYAIVGASTEDDAGGTSSGKAYIFSTSTGNLLHTLDNPNAFGTSQNDVFGTSVSISESYAVVGARGEDDAGGTESGKAYVFKLVPTTAAFRFAPDAIVSTRSPYIQNCSVIFNHTPALNSLQENYYQNLKGALVDGADVDPNSNEAGMLFHSCTFITPYTDALVATNGARVEWLNSFTYFANRGIYAYNGTTGHLSSDGSTIKYGAEIRSIGSANVYGNYGVVGDGNSVTVYLINHNFAYIGLGTDVTNDKTLTVKANQVVKQNSANIYFSEIDAAGEFAVGDNFFVNQQTGNSSIVITESTVAALNGLTVSTNNQIVQIDGSKINIGNFILQNNEIITTEGDINVNSAGGLTNFTSNVFMQQNLSITNNLNIDGNVINFGNQLSDTLSINIELSQDIIPVISNRLRLGISPNRWKETYLSSSYIGQLYIQDNFLESINSNEDIEFRANGIGKIYIPNNNFDVTNNFAAYGNIDIKDINITGNKIVAGNSQHNLNSLFTITGTTTISDSLITGSDITFPNIKIAGNKIFTNTINDNLELQASGNATISILQTETYFNKGLTVNELIGSNITLTDSNVIFSKITTSSQIEIFDNVITTSLSNSNLELRTAGTGLISLADVDFFNNNISTTDDLIFYFQNVLEFTGTKAIKIPVGTSQESNLSEGKIRFNQTTELFEGFGNAIITFGGVYSQNQKTNVIADKLTDEINFYVNDIPLGNITNSALNLRSVIIDDIQLDNNKIETIVSNSNLEIRTNSNKINSNDILIQNNVIENESITNLSFTSVNRGYYKFSGTFGIVVPTGNEFQRGNLQQVGELRYNTSIPDLEIYTGTEWQVANGGGQAVTNVIFEDIVDEWALILG